jgi:hypothetical protein
MISGVERWKNAWPWLTVIAVFTLAFLLLLAKNRELERELDSCVADNLQLRDQLDVANMAPLLSSHRQVEPALSEFELRRLKHKGLRNPVFDLLQDLAEREDLVPADAFFGGSMHIIPGESYVLTDRWVLAGFEDGHVRGNLWLEYDVSPPGHISWRVLGWHMN